MGGRDKRWSEVLLCFDVTLIRFVNVDAVQICAHESLSDYSCKTRVRNHRDSRRYAAKSFLSECSPLLALSARRGEGVYFNKHLLIHSQQTLIECE